MAAAAPRMTAVSAAMGLRRGAANLGRAAATSASANYRRGAATSSLHSAPLRPDEPRLHSAPPPPSASGAGAPPPTPLAHGLSSPHPRSPSQPALSKSTHAAAVGDFTGPYDQETRDEEGYVVTSKGYRKKADPLDLSFLSHEAAFKSKTTWEVTRALLVFHLCTIRPLVQNSDRLMKLGQTILGKRLFASLMKISFYGHFVAGEDRKAIKPTIHRMHSFGVKSILDYSVEEDITDTQEDTKEMDGAVTDAVAPTANMDEIHKQYRAHSPNEVEGSRRRYKNFSARTYFYENEAACEKNMETFLKSIEAVADSTHCTGFSAIKLTALGRPSLLLQLSEVIVRARQYYKEISGKEGFVIEGKVSPEAFEKRFKARVDYEDVDAGEEVKEWLEGMTYDRKGLIHLFSWSGLIDSNKLMNEVFKVPNLKTGKMEPMIHALTDEEEELFRNMLNRVETIFKAAKDLDVRVLVDAEQSYFQPAIHRLTMEMMKKFNTEKAIVFNTYQCYLKKAHKKLLLDLEQAARQDFYFGAKLVRGAYMVQERERAAALGYEDPINPNYEATTEMYHKCLLECMNRMKDLRVAKGQEQRIGIMVASHNADTVRFAIKKMDELGIRPEDRLICFGQLLGMCDNISFPLGQAGYSVYKYVPYGPVDGVLPYLSRRAQENQGMLTKLDLEKTLLRRELVRRIGRGQLFFTPDGDYVPVGFEKARAFQR